MSFFPDVDELLEVRVPAGPAAPEDVLAKVKTEGLRRRTRRHRRNTVLAVLGLAVVAVPAASLVPSGDRSGLTVASEGDSEAEAPTTEARRPATTVASGQTTAVPTTVTDEPVPVPTTAARPGATPQTTVPAAPACRNSADPACGEFRWDPAPEANDPMTAAFVDAPSVVAAGEAVTFAVAWSDPEAALTFDDFAAGDEPLLGGPCTIERRYGPWTPPAAARSGGELSYTHVFDTPGQHVVRVYLAVGQCGSSPYFDEIVVTHTLTVE